MAHDSAHLTLPSFVDTAGRLPPMWKRRVVFFANLLSIFFENTEQTQVLSKQVGELDSYSARLIPLVDLLFRGSDNVLVLERSPDAALCHYMQNVLGLSLPKIVVLSHEDYLKWGKQICSDTEGTNIEAVTGEIFGNNTSASDDTCLDGYVTDETLTRLASALGGATVSTAEGSHTGNNKLLLHQFLAAAGLPTLDTAIAESSDDVPSCAHRLSQLGYSSAIVRSQIGASGIGMVKLANLHTSDSLQRVPNYFFHEGSCLIQGWLAPGERGIQKIRSPSTQLFLDESTVYAFDLTEQILSSDSIHEGNESPPPYLDQLPGLRSETIRQAEIVGGWLHQTGYRGPASIDWLVVERGDVVEDGDGGRAIAESNSAEGINTTEVTATDVYVCEINARVTGATYPSILAKYFHPSGAWLLRNLRLNRPTTSAALLQIFDDAGHLFHSGNRAGILPLNFNFGHDGLVHKGQFICIGDDTDQCHELLRLAEQDLPGSWKVDRD